MNLAESTHFLQGITHLTSEQARLSRLACRQGNTLSFEAGHESWSLRWSRPDATHASSAVLGAIDAHFLYALEIKAPNAQWTFFLTALPWEVPLAQSGRYGDVELIQATRCQILAPLLEAVEERLGTYVTASVCLRGEKPFGSVENPVAFELYDQHEKTCGLGLVSSVDWGAEACRLFSSRGYEIAIDRWLSLPCPVSLEIGRQALSMNECIALEPGDAILIDQRTQASVTLRLVTQPKQAWQGQINAGKFYVQEKVLTMEDDVNDEWVAADESGTEITGLVSNKDIPVTLSFSLGSYQLPFGDLAEIAPGYVMPLPANYESKRVDILANGVRVGVGELVTVADRLAVRLDQWSPQKDERHA